MSTPPTSRRPPSVGRRSRSAGWRRWLPVADWLATSTSISRRSDLVAGLTVAAMLVPQGMAYAALAGMPPVTGLYAATVPLIVYALLGTSGQLAVGPVAIVSLLTASTIAPVAGGDPGAYIALAGLLALLVGAIQLVLGLLRAGQLTALLSHPVISGFTSAAAVVIATSQLDRLLGVEIGRPEGWLARITALLGALDATHLPTLGLGLIAMALLVLGKRLGPRVPTALLVVVLATVAVPLLGLEGRGIAVVGEVPRGLPAPSLPMAPLDAVLALLPGAGIIAVLAYLEGLSVARAIARRTHDRIDPDQELIASGAANLAAGVFQAFPLAGGFSRTAVNHAAGARTPLASVVSAAGVVLALLFLAPLLSTLPEVILAAIVVVAVAGLVDLREARHAWQVERTDGLALAITFVATLTLGVEIGIGVGIAASLLLSLWRVGVPRLTTRYVDGDILIEVEGDLLPASSTRLAELIEEQVERHAAAGQRLVVDLSGVPTIDLSGVQVLGDLERVAEEARMQLELTGLRRSVQASLRRAGLHDRLVRLPDAGRPAAELERSIVT